MAFEIRNGEVAPSELTCQNCPFFTGATPIKGLRRQQCRFDQKRLGGFKGTRPHYIGYRLITDRVENHAAKQDFMTCQNWVRAMQDRADFGAEQLRKGLDGERIRIFRQEGEPIRLMTSVMVNSHGEAVRPSAELRPHLLKAGMKIAPDSSAVSGSKDFEYETVVPNFAEEQKKMRGHSDAILGLEYAEVQATEEVEDALYEAAQKRMKAKQDLLVAEPVQAEPVTKRGPGRPPNPKFEMPDDE